jgi:hypothetical protein
MVPPDLIFGRDACGYFGGSPGQKQSRLRHCEERSDEAIHSAVRAEMDCFASLAMTVATKKPPQGLFSEFMTLR